MPPGNSDFSQILRLWDTVARTAASGCLTVCHREKEARLYFQHGILRYAQVCGAGIAEGNRALEDLKNWRAGQLAWRDDLKALTQNVTVEHGVLLRRSFQAGARLGRIAPIEDSLLV